MKCCTIHKDCSIEQIDKTLLNERETSETLKNVIFLKILGRLNHFEESEKSWNIHSRIEMPLTKSDYINFTNIFDDLSRLIIYLHSIRFYHMNITEDSIVKIDNIFTLTGFAKSMINNNFPSFVTQFSEGKTCEFVDVFSLCQLYEKSV